MVAKQLQQQPKILSYGERIQLASSPIPGSPVPVAVGTTMVPVQVALASESAPRLSPRTIEKPQTKPAKQTKQEPQDTPKSRYSLLKWRCISFMNEDACQIKYFFYLRNIMAQFNDQHDLCS